MVFAFVARTAAAQEQGLPADRTDEPPSAPTSDEWRRRYEDARAKLVGGDFADAAVRFADLESTATNDVDRALARSQRALADEWTSRNIGFSKRSDLTQPQRIPSDHRSTDEIVSLYASSVLYGLGSGLWLIAVARPDTVAAGVIPMTVLTAGAVGTVIALDSGRGLRYGVAQSIVTGLWLGLEEGMLWTLWESELTRREEIDAFNSGNFNPSNRGLEGPAQASIVWGSATAGALLGGVLGSKLDTTPGRSAWTGSVGLWSGTLFGCFIGAGTLETSGSGGPTFAGAAVAGLLGTGVGMASAGSVSPSISRVRYIDLSAIVGGTAALLTYAVAAERPTASASAGVTGFGVLAGLVVGWVATSSIPKDPLRASVPETPPTSSLPLHRSVLARLRPTLAPPPSYLGRGSGAMIGVGGTLD